MTQSSTATNREGQIDYQSNYMNRILINPLAGIMEAVNNGQTLTALHQMRNYIQVLLENLREKLEETQTRINNFLFEFYSIRGRNYSNTGGLRLRHLESEGNELCSQAYDKVFMELNNSTLFEFVKFGAFFDPSKGRKSD